MYAVDAKVEFQHKEIQDYALSTLWWERFDKVRVISFFFSFILC